MSYITYEELCAEIEIEAEEPEEAIFDEKQAFVQEYIETLTGQFFEARASTLTLSGTGNGIIVMPVPIIDITKIEFKSNGVWSEYALANFSIFNRYFPDDRKYPKIEYELGIFPAGSQNVRVTGSFGYVDADGNTPQPIKKVNLILLITFLPNISDVKGLLSDAKILHRKNGDIEVRMSEAISQGILTGVHEVDNILRLYTRAGSVSSF